MSQPTDHEGREGHSVDDPHGGGEQGGEELGKAVDQAANEAEGQATRHPDLFPEGGMDRIMEELEAPLVDRVSAGTGHASQGDALAVHTRDTGHRTQGAGGDTKDHSTSNHPGGEDSRPG
jgi:hypothetical protein